MSEETKYRILAKGKNHCVQEWRKYPIINKWRWVDCPDGSCSQGDYCTYSLTLEAAIKLVLRLEQRDRDNAEGWNEVKNDKETINR